MVSKVLNWGISSLYETLDESFKFPFTIRGSPVTY